MWIPSNLRRVALGHADTSEPHVRIANPYEHASTMALDKRGICYWSYSRKVKQKSFCCSSHSEERRKRDRFPLAHVFIALFFRFFFHWYMCVGAGEALREENSNNSRTITALSVLLGCRREGKKKNDHVDADACARTHPRLAHKISPPPLPVRTTSENVGP